MRPKHKNTNGAYHFKNKQEKKAPRARDRRRQLRLVGGPKRRGEALPACARWALTAAGWGWLTGRLCPRAAWPPRGALRGRCCTRRTTSSSTPAPAGKRASRARPRTAKNNHAHNQNHAQTTTTRARATNNTVVEIGNPSSLSVRFWRRSGAAQRKVLEYKESA